MFGKISIDNPSDFQLNPELYSSERFRRCHTRAFRPNFHDDDRSITLLLGTLQMGPSIATAKQAADSIENDPSEINRLDGLFLLVHYNKADRLLKIINNNYQLTKLYYVVEGNCLYFSHQLALLLPQLKVRTPCFPSLLNFMRNGFNQSELTQIEGVKKLLPSQWITVGDGQMQINNRWRDHYVIDRKGFDDIEAHLDRYEATYQSTLNGYLEARQPEELATLLSGGHDTSYVLIQASKAWKKPVHCFTTIFPGWGFSERSYAESTCRKFGGIFHPQEFAGSDLNMIIDLILSCEEPVLGSSLPLHALAKSASNYTDTIMGGDGGDTLWGEYHPVGEIHRWAHKWPKPLRTMFHNLAKWLRDSSDWERFWELEHVTRLFARDDIYDSFLSELCTYRHFSPQQLESLLSPEFSSAAPAKSCMEIPFTSKNFDEALIEGKLLNGFFTYQSFQQTRSMNAFGMEFFLPVVQKDMMDFVNSLPMRWINGGTTFHRMVNSKTVNRKFHKFALARYLKKEEIYNRSFDIPWHLVWKDRESTLTLIRRALKKRGWFQADEIDQLFREFLSQKNKDYELLELKSHGYRIMTLLSVEIWARLFLDHGASMPGPEVSIDEFLAG